MEWTTAHLAELAAGHGDLDARSKAKRCGELSLLHAYLRFWVAEDALPAEPFARHLDAWHQTLRQSCEEPLLRQATLAYPPGGLYLAQPYLWLRRSGYRFGRWEDALATLSRSGARPDSVGLVHCLWKAGVLRTQPDWRTALVRWLAAWGEDERSWDHSAYRISHAAFYVTDFGNQDPPVDEGDRERLVALAQHLLVRWLARERWDLVCELLVALTCLGRVGAANRQATRTLCATRRADGTLPADRVAAAAHSRTAGDEAFRSSYHTTMVDVMRCALAMREWPPSYRAELGAVEPALRADRRIDGTRMLPIRQDHVERILEDHVRALGCDVHRGHEVVDLARCGDRVHLRVRGPGGREHDLRAGYVVGCDGGHSTVRVAAGIAFPGTAPTLTGYQAEVTIEDPHTLRRGWHRTPGGSPPTACVRAGSSASSLGACRPTAQRP
ncbi:MAG: DUF6895 family protein [Solirubrobacteraceae bacterium]